MPASNNKALTQLSSQLNTQISSQLSEGLLLPQAATATLEMIINKALALNNNQAVSFIALNQKTLTLELAEFSFPLSFTVDNSASPTAILVRTATDVSECTINTSIGTLKKLQEQQSLTQLIKQDELDVSGDIKVAQQFANIAQALQIDWQTELAKHLGDIPTHKLLQFGNKITKTLSETAKQFEADIGEYLVHEKRLVVTTSQINAFNQQTKDLVKQVDVVAMRIDKLIANLSTK